MYVANAWKQTQRSKPKDDSANTAGTSKVPSVTARSKAELKELGDRLGWTARALDMKQIQEMSSQECLWHEVWNSANYQQALAVPNRIAANRNAEEQWAAKRIWDDHASETETQAAIEEVATFTRRYPQFIGSRMDNRNILLGWLRDRNLRVDYVHLVDAFEALAIEGRIALNPSAIGAGVETEVTGSDLTQHQSFHLLLQARNRVSEQDQMSADQFLQNHPELQDHRVPPLIARRQQVAETTASHFAKASSAVNEGEVVRVTDYGEQPRGGPPARRDPKANKTT